MILEGFTPGQLRIECADPDLLLRYVRVGVCALAGAEAAYDGGPPPYMPRAIYPAGFVRLTRKERDFLAQTIFCGPPQKPQGANTLPPLKFIDATSFMPRLQELAARYAGVPPLEQLAEALGGYGYVKKVCTATSMAGLATASVVDKKTDNYSPDTPGERPGLHIDQWYRMPLDRRFHVDSWPRLIFNMGPVGMRRANVMFPDIQTMADTLGLSPGHIPTSKDMATYVERQNRERRRVFCLSFPLPAGAGYLLPSEAVGHDGSTLTIAADQLPTTTLLMHTDLSVGAREPFPDMYAPGSAFYDLLARGALLDDYPVFSG